MNSHKTAKHRKVMSKPCRYLFNKGLIKGNVLDYGCGRGRDVIELRKLGFQTSGYDSRYSPKKPMRTFRTVLMTYVVNTLRPAFAKDAVKRAWQHVAKGGTLFITARTVNDVEYEAKRGKWKPFWPCEYIDQGQVGYYTTTKTYQCGYVVYENGKGLSLDYLTRLLKYRNRNGRIIVPQKHWNFPVSKAGGAMLAVTKRPV